MLDLYLVTLWLYIIWIFFVAIMIHEAGHIFFITIVLKKSALVSYNAGRFMVSYPLGVSGIEKVGIAAAGVILGFLPIWIYTSGGKYFGFFLLLYLIGSRRDIWIALSEGWKDEKNTY